MHAAGTIGTRAAPVSCPRPRSSHQRMTPAAASRPKALPPVSSSAVTSLHRGQRRQQVGLAGRGPAAAHLHRRPPCPAEGAPRCTRCRPPASVQWPTRTPGDVAHHGGGLRLAGGAPVGAALGDAGLEDRRAAARAGLARVQVHAQQVLHRAAAPRASRGSCRWTRRRPSTAAARRSRMARCRRRISSSSRLPAGRSGMDAGLEERLVDVHVAQAGDQRLVQQHRLDRAPPPLQQVREHPAGEARRQRLDADPRRSSSPRGRRASPGTIQARPKRRMSPKVSVLPSSRSKRARRKRSSAVRRGPGAPVQAPGHAQVHGQGVARVELHQQVLAAAADRRRRAAPRPAARTPRGSSGLTSLGSCTSTRCERPPRDALGELAPDRLDLRELRHRPAPPPAPAPAAPTGSVADPQAAPATISRPRSAAQSSRAWTTRQRPPLASTSVADLGQQLDAGHAGPPTGRGAGARRPSQRAASPIARASMRCTPARPTGAATSSRTGAGGRAPGRSTRSGSPLLGLHPALGRLQRGAGPQRLGGAPGPLALVDHPRRLGQLARRRRTARSRRSGEPAAAQHLAGLAHLEGVARRSARGAGPWR